MMDCKTIILEWLRANDMDGLCEPDTECGCGLDDIAPCGDGPYPHCRPAKARTLGEGEYIGDCGPGETAYFVGNDGFGPIEPRKDTMDDLITQHEPQEDCDCHACAVEFRNRYKVALAGVSEEMGLPPMMGPAKGALKKLIDDGKTAIDSLRAAPRAISAEADFDALTWTFKVARDCRTGAGIYALVWMGPND